jgi:hypothetical protein
MTKKPAPSVTLPKVRALLKAADIGQYDLIKAGIGSHSAQKLMGKVPGEVSVAVLEKALALAGKELTTRRKPIA